MSEFYSVTKSGADYLPLDCPVCKHTGLWDIGGEPWRTVLCIGCFRVFSIVNGGHILPSGDINGLTFHEIGVAKNIVASEGKLRLQLHPTNGGGSPRRF